MERQFPTTVLIAGIAWITFGGIMLANLALVVLLFLAAGGHGDDVAKFETLVISLFLALIGAVFIQVGVQSVRGTAKDTLGNGLGSVLFGLLYFGGGLMQGIGGLLVQASVSLMCGGGLFAAGILALIGRREYKHWKRERQTSPEGNSTDS